MRRRTLFKKDSGTFSGNVADAVFYDSNSDCFITMTPDEITGVVDGYTPIGVVVIPAEHDVYGDGTCGVMSLAEMHYNTPDVGSSAISPYVYWGDYNTDISLPNLDKVNLVNGTTYNYGYLPSDRFTGTTSLDGVSKYNGAYYNTPSPFNADGSRNEAYYTTAYSTANALSDFDGVGNTAVLTELATTQSDWKTATTITNSYNPGYYPAACCTWRFHTAGTDQGQWYLPAMGELGYVMIRFNAINETISKVLSVYSSVVAVALNNSNLLWSSSKCSRGVARSLQTSNSEVSRIGMNGRLSVRAFLRV